MSIDGNIVLEDALFHKRDAQESDELKKNELPLLELGTTSSANCSNHQLRNEAKGIYSFHQLTVLKLSNCGLTFFSDEIFSCLPLLRELDISNNKIKRLPKSFCLLEKLEFFNGSHNAITSLPREIGKLQALKEVMLEHNALRHLPRSFANLEYLETLNLSDNHLDRFCYENDYDSCVKFGYFPSVLCSLPALRHLSMENNAINHIPGEITEMKSLESLLLGKNQIPYVHLDVICALTRLKKLDLSSNNLYSIPDKISNLALLENLILSDNVFFRFEKCICLLKNLKELRIDHNFLRVFPDGLCVLQYLKKVDFQKNPLDSLLQYPLQQYKNRNNEPITIEYSEDQFLKATNREEHVLPQKRRIDGTYP